MRKNRAFLKFIVTGFTMLTIANITNTAMAVEFKAKPYNEKYIEWLNLPEDERAQTVAPAMYVKNLENTIQTFSLRSNSRLLGTKSDYNLLDEISLKVKNQMETGQCWAFATTTQLESYMAKVKSKTVEYSPRHIEYSTSKTFLDGTNPVGFNRELNSGGNSLQAYVYMIRGQGPVLEEDMPFVNTNEKINLADIQGKIVQAQLEEFITFPSIYKEINNGVITYTNGQEDDERVVYTQAQVNNFRNKVKEHIMTYGAVTAPTSTASTKFFSNQEVVALSKAYNCDDETITADHQIAIIGWDDNYAVSNFKEIEESEEDHRPTSPGAWIIQNSYGTEIEDAEGNKIPMFNNGYLYISYEDCLIETLMTGIISLDEVDYDDVYQYDALGMVSAIGVGSDDVTMANVYEKGSKTAYLNEVGFYTIPDQTYEIYVNSVSGKLDENLVKVKTVGTTESNYITVDLDTPIKLTGNEFVVAIKYIADEDAVAPVECKNTFSLMDLFSTATSNEKESYVSLDGTKWNDCSELSIIGMSNINACIKAFTTNTTSTPVNITLKSNAYEVATQDKIIAKVLPNTNVTNFKNNLITDGTVKLYNKNGEELSGTEIIVTGVTLKISETSDTYKIAVTGDISGDGKITATDLLKLKKDLVNLEKLSGEYKCSADINYSGTLTSTDLLKMKQIICEIIEL